jgi:hypothetical protein
VSLVGTTFLFHRTEKLAMNARSALQQMVTPDQTVSFTFDPQQAQTMADAQGEAGKSIDSSRAALTVIYSYGDFTAASNVARSDEKTPVRITRESCVPANKLEAFLKNPFANLDAARTAPLKIDKALLSPVPASTNGWLVATSLYLFMAFYALGPGVCVWLALSELMPTRIRSNGMSIALVINQLVSTTLAAIFLPVVSKYGYATMFFVFAAFTAVYFVTAVFFLPETKGKTLEEIEEHFEGRPMART